MNQFGTVALIGRPNAGKSSLLNHILEVPLMIVSPKAQTTRNATHGIYTKGNVQIRFIDTPGVHQTRIGGVNAWMMDEVRYVLSQKPDLIWYLVDPGSGIEHEAPVLEVLRESPVPIYLLFTKLDQKKEPTQAFRAYVMECLKLDATQAYSISTRQQPELIEVLLNDTAKILPTGPWHFDPDQLSDASDRFFVAELIREQLFLQTGEEVPYSGAVVIHTFKEAEKRIEATVFVERESQKGMLIGKNGSKIKSIGTEARKRIENHLDMKQIFLGLRVKVLKNWTKKPEHMQFLGYRRRTL